MPEGGYSPVCKEFMLEAEEGKAEVHLMGEGCTSPRPPGPYGGRNGVDDSALPPFFPEAGDERKVKIRAVKNHKSLGVPLQNILRHLFLEF